MREFAEVFVLALCVPLGIVLWKLCVFIWDKDFQEWWVTLIWLLAIPITSIIIFTLRREI